MRRFLTLICGLTLAVAATAPAWAGYLTVTDTTHKSLMLFNQQDGSLVNASYLAMSAQGMGNPIAAQIVAANEFWVTDKSNDQILRYQLDNNAYLGAISNANIVSPMGMEVSGNTVWVANASSSLHKVAVLSASSHTVTGSFNAGSTGTGIPFDVQLYNPAGTTYLLVGNQTGNYIDLFTTAGVYSRLFHHSTGSGDFTQPQQISVTASNSVLVAGSTSPNGVYEYDNTGTMIHSWTRSTGVRGVYELGNGNIIFTDTNGVHIINRANGTVSDAYTGIGANYIEMFTPEPASLGLLAIVACAALRRR
jgi:DNA-binding beta-propeller fold protein YncE